MAPAMDFKGGRRWRLETAVMLVSVRISNLHTEHDSQSSLVQLVAETRPLKREFFEMCIRLTSLRAVLLYAVNHRLGDFLSEG